MRTAPTLASIVWLCLAAFFAAPATATKSHHGDGGVPALNVEGSCHDAQKFSSGVDRNNAFKGCMTDELAARDQLAKRWSQFKPKDRSDCVEQSRDPSPSYVEVLTCLEMDTDAIRNAPKVDGKSAPQTGGPAAPGLSTSSSSKAK